MEAQLGLPGPHHQAPQLLAHPHQLGLTNPSLLPGQAAEVSQEQLQHHSPGNIGGNHCRAFVQVLIQDLGPPEDLFCEIVLIWSSLEHKVLICSLSSWSGMKMKKVCRFLSWFFRRRLVVRFLMRCVTFCQGPAGKPALPHQ